MFVLCTCLLFKALQGETDRSYFFRFENLNLTMDLETYNSILIKKGENPYDIPNDHGTGEGLTRAHIAFRKDLLRKKIVCPFYLNLLFMTENSSFNNKLNRYGTMKKNLIGMHALKTIIQLSSK